MSQKILLIVYQFCPKGQIGTRRWSKFAKYLAREGYEVHVLCARYPYRDSINWCHEVEGNPQIHIHRIAPWYPTYLLKPERNFSIKLFDRICSHSLFYMDMSQHWGWALVPAAKKLIRREGITKVIASGGPFMALYHTARIKDSLGDQIRLIMDFRDPWSKWLPTNSTFAKFKKRRAEKLEKYAVLRADSSLFTTKQLQLIYEKLVPETKSRYEVLYNGYDPDDFKDRSTPQDLPPLSMVYTGSLIVERVDAVVAIIRALAGIEDEFLHQHLQINLYGFHYQPPVFDDPNLEKLYHRHVAYKGVVSQQEVFGVLAEHDICLSINAIGHEYLIGAKTFDYMGLGKKIFLISRPGELADILRQREQYVADYDEESITAALLRMKADYERQGDRPSEAQYEEFDYRALTAQLIDVIEGNH